MENHFNEKGKNHGHQPANIHYMREGLHNVGNFTNATYPIRWLARGIYSTQNLSQYRSTWPKPSDDEKLACSSKFGSQSFKILPRGILGSQAMSILAVRPDDVAERASSVFLIK
jgi:hypothetical protein